jgi:riboflavin synthase
VKVRMGGSTRAAARARAGSPRLPVGVSPVPRSLQQDEQVRRRTGVFTGIVEELGEVVTLERHSGSASITVRGPLVSAGAGRGDSIAVNGVCLTVTDARGGQFSADVMGETLACSGLGALAPGSRINLERPLRLDGRLGGHLVQGHVDGTGTIAARRPAGDWEVVRIRVPAGLARYVVHKGSVAVDGVSLTISAIGRDDHDDSPGRGDGSDGQDWIEVSLIPETLARTTLGRAQPGELVNLEVDMIAKYVERLVQAAGQPA